MIADRFEGTSLNERKGKIKVMQGCIATPAAEVSAYQVTIVSSSVVRGRWIDERTSQFRTSFLYLSKTHMFYVGKV